MPACDALPMSQTSFQHIGYAARIAFVVELAERLHTYGTTAQRLEGALVSVSQTLGLDCEPMANPTGMVLTFSDPTRPPGESDTTRVIRVPPGDDDLAKLCEADRIAEDVMAGRIGLAEGYAALRALDRPASRRDQVLRALAFGLSAASVAGLLRLPWLDIGTAGAIGMLVGTIDWASSTRPRLREASEALSAMVAATVAIAVAALVGPLNLNTVIIAALIVLMPGMTLTNAFNELTSQHLVSGMARIAGAMSTMLKLTVGTMIALMAAQALGIEPHVRALRPQPHWVEWCALATGGLAFAVLFRAARRDWPLVIGAAMSGYVITRLVGDDWGGPVGIFVAALVLTAGGNAYARWTQRPGALVRVPGIILMVPGSSSVRGVLTLIQQQDFAAGQQAAMAVINILLALIAGLLFGNLLLPTRRNL